MVLSSLRRKFILAFTPLLAVILLFGLFGLRTFGAIHGQLADLNKNLTASALAMMEMKAVQSGLVSSLRKESFNRAQAAAGVARLRELMERHRNLEQHSHEAGKQTAHSMMHRAIRVISLASYLLDTEEKGLPEEEQAEVTALLDTEMHAMEPLLEEHLATHLQELNKTEISISDQYHLSLMVVGGGIGLTVLLTLAMLLYLMRTVTEPVRRLQEGVRQVGQGDLQCTIDVHTGDELEELAGAFHEMAARLDRMYRDLDATVQERTRDLHQANRELKDEVSERRLAQEEQQRAEEQVHFLTRELLRVQEAERQQIALDLHDNVAQELSSLKVALETGMADFAGEVPGLQGMLAECDLLLKQAIRTVRELSYNLRPPGLEQMGVGSSLADFCREFAKKTGITVDFSAAGMENLDLDYTRSINIFRLAQEALQNAGKHAAPHKVTVRLVASHPTVILRVEDDGKGFAVAAELERARQAKKLGLLGMQERVSLMGGQMRIHAQEGQGTKIIIEIPWEKSDDNQEESTHSR